MQKGMRGSVVEYAEIARSQPLFQVVQDREDRTRKGDSGRHPHRIHSRGLMFMQNEIN